MNQVWRLNIKPDADEEIDPRLFCINQGILGIGWSVGSTTGLGSAEYIRRGKKKYLQKGDKGWWPAVNAIINRMEIGDLCWTRDRFGIYYLGRLISDWRYAATSAHLSADVVNIRDCEWYKIGTADHVPGKVLSSFIPARTVQRIWSDTIAIYSKHLFNVRSNRNQYTDIRIQDPDLFSLLSAFDCEDLLGLYLQDKGVVIYPSSCKVDTMGYEFVGRNITSQRKIVAQVKTGMTPIVLNDYRYRNIDTYLFAVSEHYIGRKTNNQYCISRDEMEHFIYKNKELLPDSIQEWITIHERLQ